MKYIKTYENFKEMYKIDPNKEVVIRDENLYRISNRTKFKFNSDIDRINRFKGRVAKMTYNQDDFFTTLYFDDETFRDVPAYTLINKEEYELNNSTIKYNL